LGASPPRGVFFPPFTAQPINHLSWNTRGWAGPAQKNDPGRLTRQPVPQWLAGFKKVRRSRANRKNGDEPSANGLLMLDNAHHPLLDFVRGIDPGQKSFRNWGRPCFLVATGARTMAVFGTHRSGLVCCGSAAWRSPAPKRRKHLEGPLGRVFLSARHRATSGTFPRVAAVAAVEVLRENTFTLLGMTLSGPAGVLHGCDSGGSCRSHTGAFRKNRNHPRRSLAPIAHLTNPSIPPPPLDGQSGTVCTMETA